ncbi:sodium:solute symporter [Asanoa sp. NPDC050611]|uniref:sodium:solute symporter family protein n=1 Tax=Asanoa sp. NPDC050611 TaxID=3157098 RepID=UPI0033D91A57
MAHRHGLLTPGEFARARFGSPGLGALVAFTGIVATMPYVAVQLLALRAVFRTVGVTGEWPLLAAVGVVSLSTFRSGLRAPALLSIAKDVLLAWVVLSALLVVAMSSGWAGIFRRAGAHFASTPNPGDGLLLPETGQLGFVTLVVGSVLSVFAYPHAVTGMLAAKDRATVRRNIAAAPVYCLVLGLMGLLGFFALSEGIRPLDGDLNTVMPLMFQQLFPGWSAGIAYAALGVAALIPAAVMSISAANAFTRSIYRTYLRPDAAAAEEARVSRWASLVVKFGAVAFIVLLDRSYAVDLQLIGGVIILQTIPAVFLGLATAWFDRRALVAGILTGLGAGIVLLWDIPQVAANGSVVKAHFGGSSMAIGDTGQTVYVGLVALAVNLIVVTALTVLLRLLRVPRGQDATRPDDYTADADDPMLERLDEILDGLPARPVGAHARSR